MRAPPQDALLGIPFAEVVELISQRVQHFACKTIVLVAHTKETRLPRASDTITLEISTGNTPLQLRAHGHELAWEPDAYDDIEYLTLVKTIGGSRDFPADKTYVGPRPERED